eukprot:Hpha_TRINITY_DN11219_c0_g1::TRINITY_DN11219_c0_g1_i1::g.167417::m.167417
MHLKVSRKKLGSGGFGSVFMGLTETGDFMAVKEISVDDGELMEEEIKRAHEEYDLLASLSHPNIVQVFDFTFEMATKVARIVMEYVPGGNLEAVIRDFRSTGGMPKSVMGLYTREILAGLDYLHTVPPCGILHRDIKPANVLLLPRAIDGAHVKLADFGLSKILREKSVMSQQGNVVGTIPYLSPLAVRSEFSPQSDLWAVGCTVLQMSSGNVPWSETGKAQFTLMFHIGEREDHHPLIPDSVGDNLRDFLRACFSAERYGTTCSVVRDHQWLTDGGAHYETESTSGESAVQQNIRISEILMKTDENMRQLGREGESWELAANIAANSQQWNTSFSYSVAATSAPPGEPHHPYGPVFRDEKSLHWDILWQRISQLPRFSAAPFREQYGHILPLVQYIMCRRGMAGVDECSIVSFHDDFCPLQVYFNTVESIIEDIAELNRRRVFLRGATTQDAERVLSALEPGAMLVRPSKSEPGKLALSVQSSHQEVKHYLILRHHQHNAITIHGHPAEPTASTLRGLIDTLMQKYPIEFRRRRRHLRWK